MAPIDVGLHATMSPDEKQFFQDLGARIAQLRKDQGMTQMQLADALQITQQQLASYEIGRRRVPVSMIPALARALGVSLDELIGAPQRTARKRGPAPKLQQHMQRISELPKTQQRFVMQMLETVLAQQGR